MPPATAVAAYGIIVVGASWGGLNAVSQIVADVPPDFPLPMTVIQHRSKESDRLLVQLLQDRTGLRVCDVEDKEPVAPGHVYVAPPDYHVLLDMGGGEPHFTLSVDPPVRYSRPSIDVTFVSAADAYGPRAIGVVLTGANEDGAMGLRRIVDRGGYAIVQDPRTAEIRTMPQAALAAVPSAEVLPIERIGARLTELGARRSPAAAGGGGVGRAPSSSQAPRGGGRRDDAAHLAARPRDAE